MQLERIDVDKVDINIFYYLFTNKKTDPLYSAKIGSILEYFKTPISYYTIVRRTKKLIEKGYIDKGYKISNADTFYLSQKGIDFIKENVLNKESIYEEISIDEIDEEE